MSSKLVTISARISHEDASFISQLSIEDAKTPSDKLRAIISAARLRQDRQKDYVGSYQMIQEMIAPVQQTIRKSEVENDLHSEVITRLLEWMPDIVAFLISSITDDKEPQTKEKLLHLEQGAADRLFRLIASVLQLAVTGRCSCYDPDVLQKRIEPVLELAKIILQKK